MACTISPRITCADSANQNIVASVHIEALWDATDPVGETRWLETLDKSQGVAIRYTAAAPFGTQQAAAILEKQAALPAPTGVRRDIQSLHPIKPGQVRCAAMAA